MLELEIQQPGVPTTAARLPAGAYLVGTGKDCNIRIPRPEISARHAQLIVRDNRLIIMDLGSRNGTEMEDGSTLFPNQPYDIPLGTRIKIGKAVLRVRLVKEENPQVGGEARPPAVSDSAPETVAPAPAPPVSREPAVRKADLDVLTPHKQEIPVLRVSGVPARLRPIVQEIKKHAHAELLKRMNLKKLAVSGVSSDELSQQARTMIREILSQLTIQLPAGLEIGVIEKELFQEAVGLGPLESLIERDDLTEIMVNRSRPGVCRKRWRALPDRYGVCGERTGAFRDRTDRFPARAPHRREFADGRRPPCGRQPCECDHPAALAGGADDHDPEILAQAADGGGSGPVRFALGRYREVPRNMCGGAEKYSDLRRHRFRQDDAAECVELLSSEQRTHCDDRGRGGTAAAPGTSRAA